MTSAARTRPTAWQWLRYAFGGGLPASLNEWVLRDTTTPGWAMRHLLRTTVQIVPVLALAVLVLPGPPLIIVPMVLGGALMGYIYSVAFMIQSTEHRLIKAGYPEGTGESIREARAHDDQQVVAARYRARVARTNAKRQERAGRVAQRNADRGRD
jgi:hypothetical protein